MQQRLKPHLISRASNCCFPGGQKGTRTPDLYDVSYVLAFFHFVHQFPYTSRTGLWSRFWHFAHSAHVHVFTPVSKLLAVQWQYKTAPVTAPVTEPGGDKTKGARRFTVPPHTSLLFFTLFCGQETAAIAGSLPPVVASLRGLQCRPDFLQVLIHAVGYCH